MKKLNIPARIMLFLTVIITVLLLTLRVSSVIQNFKSFIDTISQIITNPHASYDEKMSFKYPGYFDLIKRIKSLTPENSIVYIPDISIQYGQKFWPLSNINVTSSLLFPRQVLFFNGKYTNIFINPVFVVVARGYPNVFVKARKIYIFYKNSTQELPGNYVPGKFNSDTVGLIQI